jgi:hypothetical protein
VWTLNEPQPEVPLHPRCFTGDTEVFAPDAIAISRANYSGPIYDFIIEGGAKFSITPNHMILTSRGFIPAKEVCQSDKIIGSAYINGLRQNNNRAPSNFAQIFNFLSNSDAMLTTDRNSTSDNFHGDGQFINGNIDIVGAKSLLLGGVKPCLDQLLKNEKLPLANMSNVLFPGYGKSAAMLKAMGLATQALTSGLSMSEFFSGSHSGFSDNTGLAGCSDFNAVFSKSFSNNPFAGVESVSEFIGRLPGVISLANYFFGKINPLAAFSGDFFDFISSFRFTTPLNSLPDKSVHNNFFSKSKFITDFFLHLPHEVKFFDINFLGVRDFSGHVYDLQTVSTVYHVAGMYSSNCRCMKLPLPDWSKLGLDAETMNRATRPFTVRPDEKIDAGGRRTILEAGRHQGDYASWFAGRGKIFQRNVLGPRRYELYQQGADFHSFVNSVNGELYTLKELEGR